MTIANLGLSVDSQPAVRAAVDLDKLAVSSEKAETAVKQLGTSTDASMSKVASGTGAISQKLRKTAEDAESMSARVQRAMNFKGGFGNIGSSITQDLVGGLLSVLNPANLVTAAVATITTGAIAYFATLKEKIPTAEQALKDHADLIQKIEDRWPGATEGLKRYAQESTALLMVNAREQAAIFAKQAKEAEQAFSTQVLLSGFVTGGSAFDGVSARYKPFEDAIKRLRAEVKAGKPDFDAFYSQINQIVATNPEGLTKLGNETIKLAGTLESAEQKAAAARAAIGLIGGAAAAQIEQVNQFTAAMRELSGIALPQLDDGALAKYKYEVAINRASNREDKDSAYQNYQDALARIDERTRLNNVPLPADKPNLESFALPKNSSVDRAANAYRDLFKMAQDRVAQSKLEAESAGLSGIAQDTLRFKLELLQKSQAKGRTISEAQTKALLDQVSAYEKNATAAAKATLMADLMFERQQMFRSPIDQTIASTLKGAGLPIDFNSEAAAAIRFNEQLKIAHELASDFSNTFMQSLKGGKNFFEALGEAALSTLDKISQKLMDMALDNLFSKAFGGGGSSGGGLLGIIGSLFGGGGSSASADPWAGMRMANGGAFADGVQAFANGGVFSNSVVNSPTLFKFANGTGLMGEAGPEAIMPLKRDSAGRLGVSAGGLANSNSSHRTQVDVNVSVDDDGKLVVIARQAGSQAGAEQADARVRSFSQRELPDRMNQIKMNPRQR